MSTPDTPPEAHDDAHPADADAGTPTAARQVGTPGPQPTEPAPVTGAQRALGRALGRPRPHGRIAVGLAVLAAVAIVLVPVGLAGLHGGSAADGAGATATASATPTPVSADGPLEDVLTVVGRVGAVPVVALHGPLTAATAVRSDVLTEGSGRRIATGDAVLLSVATFSGLTGENTTGTEAGTRLYRGLLEEKGLGTDLAQALDGTTEGSRVVLRAPAVSTDGSASTEITVVDVLPALSQGEERDAPAGAPKVSVDAGGVMSIDVSGTKAPSSSTASTLIEGTGRQVTARDRVIARYASIGWDGRLRSSTYGDTVVPGVIDMRSTLAGVARSLVDVPVGSRVLLRLTADQARGDVPVTVVIDVLGVADDDQLPAATATPSGQVTSAPTADSVVVVTPRPVAGTSAGPSAPRSRTASTSPSPTGR
ncbi:hypothetical protein [Actinomyces radicidentis]|uniref:Peptidylprolyl isomerase n=1 Tax=Actinomyces radicidentis TaxID=111015 RepID=A0A0X8JFT2_ACTRD|nr:hypothetical protein [Actinomyces radicidentis]AMD88035.1 hypothetical protein AXF14_11200 [Actinomyces radicidentis]